MKNYHFSLLLFFMFCFIGCKNETSVDSKTTNEIVETTKQFKVTLKFIAEKKDDFCLLYTEDNTINFGENGIWKSIEGSNNEQTVEFEMPEDVFPSQLRLDLGIKPEQTDIILKSVVLEYNGNKREIIGYELGTFFRADENTCSFDPKTGLIKSNIENGIRKNPSLYPQEPTLNQEIEKLAK